MRHVYSGVAGYHGGAANPVIRWGFRLFGRWAQERFYRNIRPNG